MWFFLALNMVIVVVFYLCLNMIFIVGYVSVINIPPPVLLCSIAQNE